MLTLDPVLGVGIYRCDENSDGKLDYTEFIKYLTNYKPPQSGAMLSTSADSYSGKTQVVAYIETALHSAIVVDTSTEELRQL